MLAKININTNINSEESTLIYFMTYSKDCDEYYISNQETRIIIDFQR